MRVVPAGKRNHAVGPNVQTNLMLLVHSDTVCKRCDGVVDSANSFALRRMHANNQVQASTSKRMNRLLACIQPYTVGLTLSRGCKRSLTAAFPAMGPEDKDCSEER